MEDCRIIEGAGVRLEALSEEHLAELRKIGNDPALWEFTFQPNPFVSEAEAYAWLHDAVAPSDSRAYAIVEKRWGRVAGSTRFAEIASEHRKLEIGWTFLGKSFWRTHINTESKFLLMRYAFEEWSAVRVAFKAEAINERSRAALLRLGATHEGTLRNFRRRPDGSVRDVAFYSVIASEWPTVKERLLRLMDRG